MDEATKQALNEFVRKMIAAAEQGASWTVDQAPLLVQEWLRWQAVEAALYMALFVPLALTASWLIKKANEAKWDDEWPSVPAILFGMGSVGYFFGLFVPSLFTLLKVLTAPRVVVFEKFVNLLK